MSWFSKLLPAKILTKNAKKTAVPEGLWTKCTACTEFLFRGELERNLHVCPKCSHHMRISARTRLDYFLDPKARKEIATELAPEDKLKFKDSKRYKDRIIAAQKATGEKDALLVMSGTLNGVDVVDRKSVV